MAEQFDDEHDLSVELSTQEIDAIVTKVVKLHEQEAGSTVNRKAESLLGQRFFAVSLFPERSLILPERQLLEQDVRDFVRGNADLLKLSNCAVGTWYDADENESYLDISVIVASRKKAVELGNEYNQRAVFDLNKKQIIELSGDGRMPKDKKLLSDEERLLSAIK